MKIWLLGCALAMLVAGCATEQAAKAPAPKSEPAPVVQPAPPPQPTAARPAQTTPVAPKQVAADPLNDPANILAKRSVYFDYDSSVLKDQFKPLVTAHAQYLVQNRGAFTEIQGNCDERGSREYNLALGQQRAETVRRAMVVLGVQDSQLEAISFGEEKPKAVGHDEAAWAENRRADIVYRRTR